MKKKTIIIIIIFIVLVLVVLNYFYTKSYNFKLIGNDLIKLNVSDTWEDPGYEIDSNKKVTVTNNVNYGKEGDYQIKYSIRIGLFKKTLKRNITIISDDQNTAFNFTMKGNNPYYLLVNNDYKEPGFEVYDAIDGLLTDKVRITDNIENKEGSYDIKYQVTNSEGITKNIVRKVIVYSFKFESKLKTNDYTQENEIILSISDNNYSYTILPDGNKTIEKEINYRVNENNTYEFNLVDNLNNSLIYKIDVTNIDKEKPTGNCVLSLQENGGEIIVTANDNKKIQGYEYLYGNNKTKLIDAAKYNIETMDDEAKVIIYDQANNNTTITCKTIDNTSKKERSYTLKTYSYNGTQKNYWFYEPPISKREKIPLVIYFHGDGGSANTNAVNNIAIPKNIKDGKDFPYYVLAPYKGTQEDFVLSLINYLTQNYQIDTKRIVITGGSSGSPAALNIASRNPNMFSGIVVIAAYYKTPNTDVNTLTTIPIWFFQGTEDSYKTMENYINRINQAGGNAKITPYKGGHDAPVNAFLRTDLTNWILTNKTK